MDEPTPGSSAEAESRSDVQPAAALTAPEPSTPKTGDADPAAGGRRSISVLVPRSLPGGRRARAVLAAVGVMVAVAVVFGGSRLLLGSSGPSGPSAPPGASIEASASGISGTSGKPGSPAVATPTAPPTPLPGASESLPVQTAPTAHITFNSLVVLPGSGSNQPATFSFVSDGPGLVSVSVVASPPTDSTTVCLSGDGGTPVCSSGATPTASFYSQSSQSKWSATLTSSTADSPTIDVAVTWPANKPSIDVNHAPFQGAPNPDSLRSLTATIQAGARGAIDISGSWAPAVLDVSLTLWEVTPSGPVQIDRGSYKAAQSLSTHSTQVKAGTSYQLTLMDQDSTPAIPPDLAATIAFP